MHFPLLSSHLQDLDECATLDRHRDRSHEDTNSKEFNDQSSVSDQVTSRDPSEHEVTVSTSRSNLHSILNSS